MSEINAIQASSSSNRTSNSSQKKLTIEKEKFCDEYFDQLVIETSRSITSDYRSELDEPGSSSSSSSASSNRDRNLGTSDKSSSIQDTLSGDRLNQPKRPMNAFMVWGQAIRRELHHKFSNVQNALLSKSLGRVWKALELEEKEPYIKRANAIKVNHKRDYPNYRYQPRRILERRSKAGVLIGINFGEPTNQQLTRQAPSFGFGTNQASISYQQATLDHYQRQSFEHRGNRLMMRANHQPIDIVTSNNVYNDEQRYNIIQQANQARNLSSSTTYYPTNTTSSSTTECSHSSVEGNHTDRFYESSRPIGSSNHPQSYHQQAYNQQRHQYNATNQHQHHQQQPQSVSSDYDPSLHMSQIDGFTSCNSFSSQVATSTHQWYQPNSHHQQQQQRQQSPVYSMTINR